MFPKDLKAKHASTSRSVKRKSEVHRKIQMKVIFIELIFKDNYHSVKQIGMKVSTLIIVE